MEKNLTEAEQAKKTRIMDAWRAGALALQRHQR